MILLGVQIGQGRKSSAFCVAVKDKRTVNDHAEIHFAIPNLERFPAGTRLPDIRDRLAEVETKIRQHNRAGISNVFVDATARGQPIVDLIKSRLYARVRPVYFTHGDKRADQDTHIDLGKAFLVSRLQVLLQTGQIHLPDTPQARTLAEELNAYEIKPASNANDLVGAFEVGTQDDLVTALGLAVQTDCTAGGFVLHGYR